MRFRAVKPVSILIQKIENWFLSLILSFVKLTIFERYHRKRQILKNNAAIDAAAKDEVIFAPQYYFPAAADGLRKIKRPQHWKYSDCPQCQASEF